MSAKIVATSQIIEQKFNSLTVLGELSERYGGKPTGAILVECRCDCGKVVHLRRSYVVRGIAVSCGCAKKSHGKTKTTEFEIWVVSVFETAVQSNLHCKVRFGMMDRVEPL